MTVKQLIAKLNKFDPNMEVRVKGTDPTDFEYQNEIECIEEDVTNWEEEMDDVEWDDDGNVIAGKKIVVIDGGMF